MVVRKSLKLITYNARGIKGKIIEFYDYLIENNIDIAFVQESHLKTNDKLRNHSKFIVLRLDRDDGRNGGGVMTVIRRGLAYKHLVIPPTQVIESLSVEIKLSGRSVQLINCYYPGGSSINQFRHDLALLTNTFTSYLLIGDFNARHTLWGCSRSNAAGNSLYEYMQLHDIQILFSPSVTHVPADPNKTPSTIDIGVTDGNILFSDFSTDEDFNISDHYPVHFTIGEDADTYNPISTYKDYERADWKSFRESLNGNVRIPVNGIDFFYDQNQINNSICFLTEVILEAEGVAVPRKQRKFDDVKADLLLSSLYGQRRALKRRYGRSHDPLLRQEIQLVSTQIEIREQELINHRFNRVINKIEREDPMHKKMFKLARCLKRKTCQIPTLKVDGRKIIDNSEKAEELANVAANAHKLTHSPLPRTAFERNVHRAITRLEEQPPVVSADNLFSVRDVRRAIACLKIGKAPGLDQITNTLIKRLPNKVVVYLTYLFNGCVKNGYFPRSWKIAKILCFKKPNKNPNDPKHYRPISLLSAIGKLYERLILMRLENHVEDENIINNEQFGFRRGHSCTHQVLRMTNCVKRAWRAKRSTAIVTLDIERAFDTVWHEGLIFKLINHNTPQYLCKIIKSFLDDRRFEVHVESSRSRVHQVVAGVPQGSLLSPLLYSIYTSDIPTPAGCELGQYADDTAVATIGLKPTTMIRRLNGGLQRISRYFQKWRIKINPTKTEAIFLTRRGLNRYKPNENIKLNGDDIQWCDTVRYLGVHIDKRLTYKSHIDKSIERNELSIRTLYSLIGRNSKLSLGNKLLIFKQIFRPGLTFAAPVINQCAATHRKRLQTAQNKVLKIILKVPTRTSTAEIHDICKVEMVNQFIQRLTESFIARTATSNNPEVEQLYAQ